MSSKLTGTSISGATSVKSLIPTRTLRTIHQLHEVAECNDQICL